MTTIFFHQYLSFAVFGSGIRDPGPEWVKIRIRDKHPGSATLGGNKLFVFVFVGGHGPGPGGRPQAADRGPGGEGGGPHQRAGGSPRYAGRSGGRGVKSRRLKGQGHEFFV